MKRHVVNGAHIRRRTPEMPARAPIVAFEHRLTQDLSAIMGEQENLAFNQALLKRFVNLMGPTDPFRPQVKIILDSTGAPLEEALLVNTWDRDARGDHARAVVEALDPETAGVDPLKYLQ